MSRPRLLDLFSGAGGSAVGYHRAGFDVVGVDIKPQPRYPFEFHQADALTFPLDGFDAVHASPPCQSESDLRHRIGVDYADLLTPTLARLRTQQLPWIVENVESTDKLPGSLVLCGTEFGLHSRDRWLRRHRRFLASFPLWGAGGCSCAKARIGGVYGTGGGGAMTRGFKLDRARAAEALGIDWMTLAELSQAIPPRYTTFIGEQLLSWLHAERGLPPDSSPARTPGTGACPGLGTGSRLSTGGPEGSASYAHSALAGYAATAVSSPQSERGRDALD